jgi:hypothetical protein
MRSKAERQAEFERREVIRKEKYAEDRARQKEKAAVREATLRTSREERAARPDVTPLTEEQLDDAARLRLRLSSYPLEGGLMSIFSPRAQSRALEQARADFERVKAADQRRRDSPG